MKILIVEDDAIIGMIASASLSMSGHEINGPAYTVAEAMGLAELGADLAFVDINLAGHDEGIGLAKTLRDRFHIPCIFVSGQGAVAQKNRDAALAFLPKPYALDDLEQSARFIEALCNGPVPPPPKAPLALQLFHMEYQ